MNPSPELQGKVILVTGGTGSFGTAFISTVLERHEPEAVRIYSRDELKQYELGRRLGNDPRLRFLIGDVRDLPRLERATHGTDVVIHAAALKHVPICEYNPFEAVQTNVVGAENVVSAAIAGGVQKTLALSTDKAVNPANLYGATKLCAEKIITQGNAHVGDGSGAGPRFSIVRYGNVMGSRGSVIPLFREQAREGVLTITDGAMTRFWITLEGAVEFVIACLGRMDGGEVFVPRIPSMRLTELASAIAPGAEQRVIGVRPGEKIHEILLTEDEARHAQGFGSFFAIYPAFPFWRSESYPQGEELPPGFRYSSDANDEWLTVEEMRECALAIAAD